MVNEVRHRTAKAGYYKRYMTYYLKDNYPLLFLGGIFILGVWLGCSFINSFDEETISVLISLLNGFILNRESQETTVTLMSSLAPSLIFAVILFFCGFCAISQPIIVLLPFFKGLGFGLSAGSMIISYGRNASFYIAVLLMPSAIISTVAIILCCREALKLSMGFFSLINPLSEGSKELSITAYCVKFIGFTGLLVLSAAVESGLYYVFGNVLP